MKLQKLLKKLALPVFALVVVGMLAACSSPSGGGSGSGSGTGTDTEKNGDGTGNGAGEQGGESGGSGQQGGATTVDAVYTFEEYDEEEGITFNYTITAKKDGTYVATVKMQMGGVSIDMPVEEGTYVLKGDKVTTTSTKEINEETGELEAVSEPLTKTFKIGANNVLTLDMSGSSGSGSSPVTKPENHPAEQGGNKTEIDPSTNYTVKYYQNGTKYLEQELSGAIIQTMLASIPEGATYTVEGTTISVDMTNAKVPSGDQASQPGYNDSDSDDEFDHETIPDSWYKIYYENDMVDAMSASALDGFAYAVGLEENTDYTIDDTAKKITLTASGYQKAAEYYKSH